MDIIQDSGNRPICEELLAAGSEDAAIWADVSLDILAIQAKRLLEQTSFQNQ